MALFVESASRDVWRERHVARDSEGRRTLFLPRNYRHIPAELRDRAQWVGYWPSKIPVGPSTHPADTTDPSTWGSFSNAVDLLLGGQVAGIGYVFSAGDPYVGIDLDSVVDPADGSIPPWVSEIIEHFATYTERSPSGRGLHLILRAKLPAGFRGGPREVVFQSGERGVAEIYDRDRFFTVTGDVWRSHGADTRIVDGQDLLESLLRGSRMHRKAGAPSRPPAGGSSGTSLDELERFALGDAAVPLGAGHEVLKDLAVRYFTAGVPIEDIGEALGGVLTTGESGVVEARTRSDLGRLLGWLGDHDPRQGAESPLTVRPGGRWHGVATRVLGRAPEADPRLVQNNQRRDSTPIPTSDPVSVPKHKSGAAHPDEPQAPECLARHPCEYPRSVTLRRKGDARGGRNIWVRCRQCDGCRRAMADDWYERTCREVEGAGWIEAILVPAARAAWMLESIKGTGARYIRIRGTGDVETFVVVWKEARETEIGIRIRSKEEALTITREALEAIDWSLPKGTKKITASKDWGGKPAKEPTTEAWEIAPVQVKCSKEETVRRLRRLGVEPRFVWVPTGKGTYWEGVDWTVPAGQDPDEFLLRLAGLDPIPNRGGG